MTVYNLSVLSGQNVERRGLRRTSTGAKKRTEKSRNGPQVKEGWTPSRGGRTWKKTTISTTVYETDCLLFARRLHFLTEISVSLETRSSAILQEEADTCNVSLRRSGHSLAQTELPNKSGDTTHILQRSRVTSSYLTAHPSQPEV